MRLESPDGAAPRLPYAPALDGIRGIAILLVFFYHSGRLVGGWIGVDLFFTLSGYLITSILVMEYERDRSIRLGRFLTRRAFRLLPALGVVLCVALVLSLLLHDNVRGTAIDAAAALGDMLNFRYAFFHPSTQTGLGHLWSLSVEEKFYIIWPIFLIVSMSTIGRKGSMVCALGLVVAIVVWRALLVAADGPSIYGRVYFGFDTRTDELLIGSALALWGYHPGQAVSRKLLWCWPAFAVMVAVVLLKVDADTRWEAVSSYPLLGAGAAFLIIVATPDKATVVTRILTIVPLVALGRISYGFYLWHYLIMTRLNGHGVEGSKAMLATFGLTLTASIASYHLIERPALRFHANWSAPRSIALARQRNPA